MRPYFLEIQAFGPYIEHQRIDFNKFSGSNLFLLHGPTGAGKTTIFDAMSCALFGATTGDRDHKQMRSDFASDNQPTIVKFCFRQRRHCYTAYYEIRKKKRSEGFDEPIRRFYRSDENGNPLTDATVFTKTSDIKNEVSHVLHFTKEQFLQIVVLPQGAFQRFLRASGDEKAKILSTIFQTERFAKVQEKLNERLTEAKKALQDLHTAEKTLLANLQLPEGESIDSYLQHLQTEQAALAQRLQELETAKNNAQQQLATDRALLDDFQRFEQRQQQLDMHLATRNTYEQQKEQKNRWENVRDLKPLFERGLELKASINEKQIAHQKTRQEKEEAYLHLQQTEQVLQSHAKQKNAAEQAREAAQSLREKLTDFTTAAKLQQEIKNVQQQLAARSNSLEVLQKEIAEIEEKIVANDKKLTELRETAQQLALYEREEKELNDRRANLQKLIAAQAAAAEAAKITEKFAAEYDMAAKAAEEAHQQYRETEQLWRGSQAALLAETLQAAQPCPVCGATEHPHPAQPADKHVSDAMLEEARQAKEQAEKAEQQALNVYQEAKTAQATQESAYQTLADSFTDGIPSQQDLEQQWQEATQKRKNAEAAQKKSEILQQQIAQLKQTLQDKTTLAKAAEEEVRKYELDLSGLQSNWQVLIERLPAGIPDAATAEKQVKALANQYAQWEQKQQTLEKTLNDARDRYTRLQTSAEEQQKALEEQEQQRNELREHTKQACSDKGFTDMNEVAALVKAFSNEKLAKLTDNITQWEKTMLMLQTQFEEAQKKVADKVKPDIEATQQRADAASQAFREHQEKAVKISSEISSLQQLAQRISELQQQISDKETAIQPLQQLFALASGDNQDKLRLHHFVLRFYFNEVLAKANLRLQQLSSGRYTLLNDEVIKGNVRDGMKLAVFDQYSGTTRPVENLSGGETFFTSLALALGLTDVITSQSGGVLLESMFIDEGFGTLDGETLDLAIRTLSELEGSQRLIGIISHVSELKERIPAKIEVIKERKGSKIVQT
jgi:exonuclease SbcC